MNGRFIVFSICNLSRHIGAKIKAEAPNPAIRIGRKQIKELWILNCPAFNVFLAKTCRKAAHIEQSERSGTLHIEWAQAHISSGHRPHID